MRLLRRITVAVASVNLLSPTLASANNVSDSLPVVDLGYGLYRASKLEFNSNGGYYNFSNIRYAAAPVGNLRFRAPESPAINHSVINDGSFDRICPQSFGSWGVTNGSNFGGRDPRENEDCLFLDIVVPKKVFGNADQGHRSPVIVWIHGGAFTLGSKTFFANPDRLIERSTTNCSDGVIWVAINYRLGAFGFLSGPTLQEDGTPNAGLHDQRFALKWVQDNIHLFGGDKNRVTVLGESAGAASIMHQMTAYGGSPCKDLFQQVIPQSPGWYPSLSVQSQEQTFRDFLSAAGVGSLAEARILTSEQLISANARQVAGSPFGRFTYGPAVDGSFVTQDPKELLNRGQFDKSVRIMVGHNADEGLIFTPPTLTSDTDFDSYVQSIVPDAKPDVIDHITNTLYPSVQNGTSAPYNNTYSRAAFFVGELVFTCNSFALDVASQNEPYAYIFAVGAGHHGDDLAYTFYDPKQEENGSGFNATVALVLQDYITSFAVRGVPDSLVDGLSAFPLFGKNASVVRLEMDSIGVARDPAANDRCRWWMQGHYH
ncbi:Carboxylesterase type B [Neofusicoccum parvum]|uniref:Carboxylesterase type B n=1 Tax=Neofusicoccum parvum TaxID=310453 RepID=A0ACB5RQW8_9PEZI|nr:Carboxylesterase type B [Neofusicoccum parvum]